MSPPLSTRAAYGLLHVTVLLWGFTAILGKSISIAALPLVFYRLWITVFVIGAVLASGRDAVRRPAKEVIPLLAVGALVAVHWVLFYACIKLAGVAVAVLCLSSLGFFTALFEPLVFARPFRAYELGLGTAVVGGVVLLVQLETQTSARGWILGIGSALFSAGFGTLNGKLAQRQPPLRLTFWELLGAAVVTSVFVALSSEGFIAPWRLTGADVGLLSALAVGCTALPWLLSLRVLRVLRPYNVALAVGLEPVYAMVLAALIWPETEKLSLRFYLGSGLLMALGPMNTLLGRRELARAQAAGGAPGLAAVPSGRAGGSSD